MSWTGWRLRRNTVGVLVDRCVDDNFVRQLNRIPFLAVASLADVYGAAADTLDDDVFLAAAGHALWDHAATIARMLAASTSAAVEVPWLTPMPNTVLRADEAPTQDPADGAPTA